MVLVPGTAMGIFPPQANDAIACSPSMNPSTGGRIQQTHYDPRAELDETEEAPDLSFHLPGSKKSPNQFEHTNMATYLSFYILDILVQSVEDSPSPQTP